MTSGPAAGVRPRILLVEDDASARAALARWLDDEYDVVAARDGIEGLEMARTLRPAPDVILSDVSMPGLDGVSMVMRIREIEGLRDVSVIFLTGQTSPASVVAGITAGARAYLYKPVDLDTLDREVRSVLAGRVAPHW
jgi:DNA-binding response OmpR family regulator